MVDFGSFGAKFGFSLQKWVKKNFFCIFFKQMALQMFRKIKNVSRIHFIDLLNNYILNNWGC